MSRSFFGPIDRRPVARPRRGESCRSGRPRRFLELEPLEPRTLLSGTWTPLTHLAPSNTSTMMLLSDGTVLVQAGGTLPEPPLTASGGATNAWYRLAPDASGSYVNGTWSQLAPMSLPRLYYASNMLTDGRVFVLGGEWSGPGGQQNWTNTGEIYSPVTNTWSSIANFPQSQFGDDPSELLPDGRVLTGYLSGPQTYIYNPGSNSWSSAANKLRNDSSEEETWVKLPDNSILSYDVFSGGPPYHAQRYIPSQNQWVDAGAVPVPLSSSAVGSELGPAFLLPDGRALFLGATGHTAFYTPATNTWAAGPDIPNGLGAEDNPGAELPNGKILFAADTPLFHGPTSIFEFDPTTNTYTDVTPASNLLDLSSPAVFCRMLVLPSGQVLLTNGSSGLVAYTPDGSPVPSGQPTISGVAENADGSFRLTGTLLNGISEGASYGDDAEMSSNYPIVRLADSSGNVYYARTYGWSSTGVATGSTPESTNFTLPLGLPAKTYSLAVVANGIASRPVPFTIPTKGNDPAPTVATAASATPNPVTGTTTKLSVRGADVAGESTLTYTWTTTTEPTGAPLPSLSADGTNAAKNATVTFYQAGNYTLTVTVTNNAGLSTTSSVGITVNQTLTSMTLTPATVTLNPGATQQFTATGLDQFGNSLITQPTFAWTLAGGGTLSSKGLYTATSSGTQATVTATTGTLSKQASVSVVSTAPTLTATAVSPSEIDLSWTAVSGAAGYQLQGVQVGQTNWGQADLGAGTTTFQNTGLAANTQYQYRVRATDGAGNPLTDWSALATATTKAT